MTNASPAAPGRWKRRALTGAGLAALLAVSNCGLAAFDVMGSNTLEEGWRAGNLADYSVSNRLFQWLPTGWFFPTGEGHLLLGNDSSRNSVLNGHTISPSDFSTTVAVYTSAQDLIARPVVIHFRKLRYRVFLGGETDVRVDEFETQSDVPLPPNCSESHGWLTRKRGVKGAKIVEAARVGHPFLWKTGEVVVHTGGNEFLQMSITDQRIYDCAVVALKTGKTMRITYDDQLVRDPVTQNTSYNLVGISE